MLDIDEITQQMDEEDILDYKRDYDKMFFTTEIIQDGNPVTLSRIYSYGLCSREAIEKYRRKERFHFY